MRNTDDPEDVTDKGQVRLKCNRCKLKVTDTMVDKSPIEI